MSINTIIEEQATKFQEEFIAIFPDREADFSIHASPEKVLDWHKQSLIQILEAEVERLKGEKKEDDGMEYIIVMNTHNQCIDDQITHITNIIKEICLEKQ